MILRALCPAVCLLLTPVAIAHVNEVQAGKLAYFDGDTFIGGGTSWGIVLPDADGEGYARVCEEAYSHPAVIPPSFSHLRSDGTILLGGFAGAFISSELGCVYEPIEDLEGSVATALGASPDGRLFLATANLGDANGVLESSDEGETWTEILAPRPGTNFFQLVTGGNRILVTGNLTDDGPTVPAVLISEDGGASFTDVSAAYSGYPLVRAGVFDGADAYLGGFNGQGQGIVLRASPPYDAPVEQDVVNSDGADIPFPSEITNIAVVPGGAGIVALARLRGVLFHQPVGGAFIQVSDFESGPTDCVFQKPDGSGLIGCGKEQTDALGLYMESTDGLTWTPLMTPQDVRYRRCAPQTGGGIACAAQYESSCDDNIDNDGDQAFDCDDDECLELCQGGEGEGEGEGEGLGEGEGEGDGGEGEAGGISGPRAGCLGCSAAPAELIMSGVLLALFRPRRRRS